MNKISEIKNKMRVGDIQVIAQGTGYTADYVKMVLRGVRKSQKVVDAAEMVVNNRLAMIEKLKQFNFNNIKNK
jgi:hypothetical protein